jgi:tetratricopeptide (TPR) repeat protein
VFCVLTRIACLALAGILVLDGATPARGEGVAASGAADHESAPRGAMTPLPGSAAGAITAPPAVAVPGPREKAEGDWLVAGWQRVGQARTASQADAALRRMEAEALARGVQSLPAPALALIRTEGLHLAFPDRLAWAKRLARPSAAVQFAAARAALTRSPVAAPALYLDALESLGQDFGYLAGLASRVLLVVTLGLALAFLAFGGAMLILFGGGVLHDLGHLLSARLPRGLAVAAAVALAGLPLIAGLGWVWLPVFWVTVVWESLSWRQRGVALAFLALVAAARPIALSVASLVPSPDSQMVMAAILHAEAGTVTAQERELLEREAARGRDPIALFSFADVSRQAGRADAAEQALRGALALRPDWSAALNNLAILLIERNNLAEAESLLRGALAWEPRSARLHYNLSYLFRRQFRLQEADQAYRRARELDAEAVDRFTQMADPLATDRKGSLAIPSSLGPIDLWRRRLAPDASTSLLAQGLARPLLGRIPLVAVAPLVAALLLGGMALARLRARRGGAGACVHCGVEVCPACFGTQLRHGVCFACHAIYTRGEKVEVMAKLTQDQRVKRHRIAIRPRVLASGALVPGLGHLLLGTTLEGTAILVLVCVSINAPLALWLSGALGGLWSPLQAAPLGGLLVLAAALAAAAAFGLGTRDLRKRLRPI